MKITYLLAALLLVSSLATPTTAQERSRKNVARTQAHGFSYAMEKFAIPVERMSTSLADRALAQPVPHGLPVGHR